MKLVLPWLLVLALSGAVGAVFVSGRNKDAEIVKLREASQDAEAVRTKLEQAESEVQGQKQIIEGLHQDTQELRRLRSEISKVRGENLQLTKQLQTARNETERAQTQASQAAQASAQAQQAQAEAQQVRAAQAQLAMQRNACINNLRMLDAAKQQWALENQRTAEAVPSGQELLAYLPGNGMPACPAGGLYGFNSVSQPTTCTIPGHALPR